MRKIAVRPDGPGREVKATFDYAGRSRGQERTLERSVADLPAGEATFVDYVDVDVLPSRQKDLEWSGGFCYGFRNAGGGWQWRLDSTPLKADADTGRLRARVWIKEPRVDALKLVFDESVPNLFVRSVTVTTQPPDALR